MFCELEQAESVVVGLVSLAHLVIPVCQKLSELPALAQESVVKAFADKVPKVVVAAADVLHTALRQESTTLLACDSEDKCFKNQSCCAACLV